MRENIIEQIRFCATHFSCDGCGGDCKTGSNEPRTAFVLNDAADAIEELLAAVPHWISVEERLPEPFVCVLAHIPGEKPFQTVKSAFLEKNGLWYSNGFRYNPEEVTHWCEMPEPPKEVE